LSAAQADRLAAFLEADATLPFIGRAAVSFVHVLYYLGGMIAIGAMSIFMTLGWTRSRLGRVSSPRSSTQCLRFPSPTGSVKKNTGDPRRDHGDARGGWCASDFLPQMALGYWGENKAFRDYHVFIDWRWIMMEFGTLAVGVVLLWRYRGFPLHADAGRG